MKLKDIITEADDYQLALSQSANLQIPKDLEQLKDRKYKDMLNKLHDLYGKGKYTEEPAHFLSTAIDYILDDPREVDLKAAYKFLHKHKNAANKLNSNKREQTMKLKDILPEAGTKPEQLYGKAMKATKSLTREMTGLFLPSTIDNLTADEIMSMIKQVDSLKSKIKNLAESK